MAYEKNTWANGDTITAEKLNHMEDGIAEGGGSGGELLVVNGVTSEDSPSYVVSDKTFGEIWQAYKSGRPIVVNMGGQHGSLNSIYYNFTPQEGGNPGYGHGDVKFCTATLSVHLSEEPYTEERLFAKYPEANFD